jgi:lipopolysaccharide biosynthesis glycosyltransferase
MLPGRVSATRSDERVPRLWFDADVVVHGSVNPLLATKIAFSCLHGSVPEKELDLDDQSP